MWKTAVYIKQRNNLLPSAVSQFITICCMGDNNIQMNYLSLKNKGKVKSENSKVTEYSRWMDICKGKEY